MNKNLFEQWHSEGIISVDSVQKLQAGETQKLFSLHWEIRTVLYLSVVLLTTGLGILVYKNIDTIGHQAILLFIALISASSFYYCSRKKLPFAWHKVDTPNVWVDYLLLLACLTFVIFIAYLQFQYAVFGYRYGLATFVPMVVLFFVAYYFDHLGILSMAITNLAAWLGFTVTPMDLLSNNDFNDRLIIVTGVILGSFLIVLSIFTKLKELKPHFQFTYLNFGMHVLFVSLLAAMFSFELFPIILFIPLAGVGFYFYTKARREGSFYLLLITSLYVYIGLTYVVLNMLMNMNSYDLGSVYLGIFYFIGSGIGLVLFLMRTNKLMKA